MGRSVESLNTQKNKQPVNNITQKNRPQEVRPQDLKWGARLGLRGKGEQQLRVKPAKKQ